MAHIEDRWTQPGPAGRRVKSERHGTGLRWLAVWVEPDGKRRKKGFATKDAAQAHLDDVSHKTRSGTYIPAERGRITVADYSKHWFSIQLHQQPSTIKVIDRVLRRQVIPTIGGHGLAAVTPEDIQLAVKTWSQTLQPATVKVAYAYTKALFASAVAEQRIAKSPCVDISVPRIQRETVHPPTVEQVQALIDTAPAPWSNLMTLIASTGLRGGEARGLTWDRVVKRGTGALLRIDRQLTSTAPAWGPLKTASSLRNIEIGPNALQALGPQGNGLIFTLDTGRPIHASNFQHIWRKYAIPLGIGGGWHQLRHFHASVLIANGTSPVAVASRLGHVDATETLKTYAHLWLGDDERMRDATDGLVKLSAPAQPPDP